MCQFRQQTSIMLWMNRFLSEGISSCLCKHSQSVTTGAQTELNTNVCRDCVIVFVMDWFVTVHSWSIMTDNKHGLHISSKTFWGAVTQWEPGFQLTLYCPCLFFHTNCCLVMQRGVLFFNKTNSVGWTSFDKVSSILLYPIIVSPHITCFSVLL